MMNSSIYEYEVRRVVDSKGSTNIDEMSAIVTELASSGWRLHTVFTNELGKNSLSVGGFGINATSDEVILIFERVNIALSNFRQCPFCMEFINKSAVRCRYCTGDVSMHDFEVKSKEEEQQQARTEAIKNKYQDIVDMIKDSELMEELNYIKRVFGAPMFIESFNKKARSLGIIDTNMTKDEIETIVNSLAAS